MSPNQPENASKEIISIESFADPKLSWQTMNDPVMGGRSTSSFSIEGGIGRFIGEVVNVPFLKSPGFITVRSAKDGDYPDVSSCHSLRLNVQAMKPYTGYRFSFGDKHVPGNRFAYGFKADFQPPYDEIGPVDIPFTDFTVRWDDATGDAVVTCQENPKYCPDVKSLKNMKTISFWGEGVAGDVDLKIESIEALCDDNVVIGHNSNSGKHRLFPKGVSSISITVMMAFVFIFAWKRLNARRNQQPYETI